MKIATLKDVKLALKNIPEKVLENFGVGLTEDGVCLACWDTEGDPMEKYQESETKYPVIKDLSNWIEAIIKFEKFTDKNGDHDTFGYEEPLSTDDLKEMKEK